MSATLTWWKWRWPVGRPRGSEGSSHPSESLNPGSSQRCLKPPDLTQTRNDISVAQRSPVVMHVTILTRSFGPVDVLRVEACVCVVVSGAPGGHEVQEGDGAGGATVPLL